MPDDGCDVHRFSAVVIDKESIVVAYHQLDCENNNYDANLKMYELDGNINKYAPLVRGSKGEDVLYIHRSMSNLVSHNNKIYTDFYCSGSENVDLNLEYDSICLGIFVTTTSSLSNEWSCVCKCNVNLGEYQVENYNMVAADDYLYFFGAHLRINRRYNIIQDEWKTLRPVPIPTKGFFCDAVRCGKYIFLFVAGNKKIESCLSTTVKVFDTTNQQWATVDDQPSIPWRQLYATVAVNERYIVVIGGINVQRITLSDSQILDTFTNIWYTSECNMSTERYNFGATVLNGIYPQLTVLGGENEANEDLCSFETISLYQLQPKLLPYWQKELSTQTKNVVSSILQAVRRGDLPIPKEIFMGHIFPYACSPLE